MIMGVVISLLCIIGFIGSYSGEKMFNENPDFETIDSTTEVYEFLITCKESTMFLDCEKILLDKMSYKK